MTQIWWEFTYGMCKCKQNDHLLTKEGQCHVLCNESTENPPFSPSSYISWLLPIDPFMHTETCTCSTSVLFPSWLSSSNDNNNVFPISDT